jgi:hypothetical protein
MFFKKTAKGWALLSDSEEDAQLKAALAEEPPVRQYAVSEWELEEITLGLKESQSDGTNSYSYSLKTGKEEIKADPYLAREILRKNKEPSLCYTINEWEKDGKIYRCYEAPEQAKQKETAAQEQVAIIEDVIGRGWRVKITERAEKEADSCRIL